MEKEEEVTQEDIRSASFLFGDNSIFNEKFFRIAEK